MDFGDSQSCRIKQSWYVTQYLTQQGIEWEVWIVCRHGTRVGNKSSIVIFDHISVGNAFRPNIKLAC